MFGFLTSVGAEAADPFADPAATEAFWRTLPQDDPIAAQRAVCAALAGSVARTSPKKGDRLRALLMLDRRAQGLIDALLADLAAGNPLAPTLGPQFWQAAFELCRSLAQAHGQFVRSRRDGPGLRGWREHQPYVLLRMLQHRKIELLLRPFCDERSTRFSWKELHEVYWVARSQDLLRHELPIKRGGLRERNGHHARARIHPRPVAGPRQCRTLPAP